MFKEKEIAILNNFAKKGLPMRIGQRVTIIDQIDSFNYDYQVSFDDSEKAFVRECELNELNEQDKEFMEYIFTGNKVLLNYDEDVIIKQVDYINRKAEIEFIDYSCIVEDFERLHPIEPEKLIQANYFEQKGLEIGQLVNKKQAAYGDSISKAYKLMQVYLENYDNGDDTYTIPKSLLKHILLQIRIIDKQNRIFNNPDGDLMEENSYADTVGYGLLGMRMIDEQHD
jgi:hypothetical protein